jgi:hypothetical protein
MVQHPLTEKKCRFKFLVGFDGGYPQLDLLRGTSAFRCQLEAILRMSSGEMAPHRLLGT